jgi:hypothetical protein
VQRKEAWAPPAGRLQAARHAVVSVQLPQQKEHRRMTKYIVTRFDNTSVIHVEAEKESKEFVWINGRRRAKVSEYEWYSDTECEAWKKIAHRCATRIGNLRDEIFRLEPELENALNKVMSTAGGTTE